MKKSWLVLNILVLLVVVFMLVWIVWTFSFSETVAPPEECIEVNKVTSFVYDICYDAYSKNIFIEAERSIDTYHINALKISFFDFMERSYTLGDVPNSKEFRAYKIPAEKNPQNIYVSLDIVKDFSAPICEEPRSLFVRYCPITNQDEEVNVSLSPLVGVGVDDFIEIERSAQQNSDVMGLNLVDKERVWKSQCESHWECGAWEDCDEGVQKRECKDVKDCFIPTEVPDTTKYCDGTCVENWECEWSDCRGGFTTPECKDLNSCGTSYNIPQKLECGGDKQCLPDIQCTGWSTCEVDYNFMDLVEGEINTLGGSKSRFCVDSNGCVDSQQEVKECSIGVDIYTKRFSKCGQDFIGVYNRLNNDLIARISEGSDKKPYLNINLDDGSSSSYCDYCYDGRMSGDEDGVDCGGSCQACIDKYQHIDFKKPTVWNKLGEWLKKMLT